VTAELCQNGVEITSRVTATAQTGVEMEALVAVSAAALTIYDMCKALDKGIEISDIYLVEKTGGKSGAYRRASSSARSSAPSSLRSNARSGAPSKVASSAPPDAPLRASSRGARRRAPAPRAEQHSD
jgi:hypothetical protein